MYVKIKDFIQSNPLVCSLVGIVLLLYCLGILFGGTDGHPAYQSARSQLTDIENQRRAIEAGIKESQSRVDSLSGRLGEAQSRVERIEDNISTTGDIIDESQRILGELKQRAEKRASQK